MSDAGSIFGVMLCGYLIIVLYIHFLFSIVVVDSRVLVPSSVIRVV
jgi:hypothetical protein